VHGQRHHYILDGPAPALEKSDDFRRILFDGAPYDSTDNGISTGAIAAAGENSYTHLACSASPAKKALVYRPAAHGGSEWQESIRIIKLRRFLESMTYINNARIDSSKLSVGEFIALEQAFAKTQPGSGQSSEVLN
jgi:hypothetical protein